MQVCKLRQQSANNAKILNFTYIEKILIKNDNINITCYGLINNIPALQSLIQILPVTIPLMNFILHRI